MKFLLDNNLSLHLAHGMREFGEDVEHLQDHFPANARDEQWLPIVGGNGWILVTRDNAIRWKPAELRAFKSSRVGAFFLAGKNRSRCDLIQQLVRNWPGIKSCAESTQRPFAFRVPPTGTSLKKISL